MTSFTVGYTTTPTGNSGSNYTTGDVFANGPYTMPQSGIIQSCSVWLSTSPTGNMQIGIYGWTSNSQPSTLLAVTSSFSATAGWETVATTTNPTILAGTKIFMGAVASGGGSSPQTLADSNAGFNLFDSGTGFSALPTTFLVPANADNTIFQLGAYATFDVPTSGNLAMSRQYFMDTLADAPLANPLTASVATTETQLWLPGQYTPIAANDPRPGKAYKVTAGGIWTNATTGTLTFTPRWGQSATAATNITMGASIARTVQASAGTNLAWFLEFIAVVRTIGAPGSATGTVMGTGCWWSSGTGAVSTDYAIGFGGTSATVQTDGGGTPGGNGIAISVTLSVAGSFTTQYAVLQSMN